MDRLGVEWVYEHEGRYFGDVFYLLDFWLPRSRQFLEVKANWDPGSCKKAMALLEHVEARPHCAGEECVDVPLIAGHPGGEFIGWARRSGRYRHEPADQFSSFLLERARSIELAKCSHCHGWWFFDAEAQWLCQCCGRRRKGRNFYVVLSSPLPGWR